VIVWRLCRAEHVALDGEGAFLFGGRWNSPGTRLVYTSRHLSLAILEILVHTGPVNLPDGLVKLEISIPEDIRREARAASDLPVRWGQDTTRNTQSVGDRWVAVARSAALQLPSAIVPEEENVLINPRHADAGRIAVLSQSPLRLDPRLSHGES